MNAPVLVPSIDGVCLWLVASEASTSGRLLASSRLWLQSTALTLSRAKEPLLSSLAAILGPAGISSRPATTTPRPLLALTHSRTCFSITTTTTRDSTPQPPTRPLDRYSFRHPCRLFRRLPPVLPVGTRIDHQPFPAAAQPSTTQNSAGPRPRLSKKSTCYRFARA